MLDRVVYGGPKRPDITAALARGFGATLVDSRPGKRVHGALHIVAGLQHGSLEILQDIRAANERYVFVDRAYFMGGPGSQWFRVVANHYQHSRLDRQPPDRRDALGLLRHLQPWRKAGTHILVVPPSQAICTLFGLGDWEADTLQRLANCTDRPIDVSRKGDPRPLADRFKDCHAVVTWTSNVAVEAVCAGVPVITSSESAAWTMAGWIGSLERAIHTPPQPANREQWLSVLAYGQWTLEEIARGEACAHLSMRGDR